MSDYSDYFDLVVEESWIDYVRSRLPYSFKQTARHTEKTDAGMSTYFTLPEPTLGEGIFSAKHHNFWKRGNAYYVVGKLADMYQLSNTWKRLRKLITNPVYDSILPDQWWWLSPSVYDSYNSMQMEKLWRFAQQNILDTERVVMTNVYHALELCLKAVMTHARFRECQEFRFDWGHDVTELYGALPSPLQSEIELEARVFARDYRAFRNQVEAEVRGLLDNSLQDAAGLGVGQPDRADWGRVGRKIDQSSYTAFMNTNDPMPDEDWFAAALDRMMDVPDIGRGLYFRYAPGVDMERDELPTDLVALGLLLGRFMYEYLFPVPLDSET